MFMYIIYNGQNLISLISINVCILIDFKFKLKKKITKYIL